MDTMRRRPRLQPRTRPVRRPLGVLGVLGPIVLATTLSACGGSSVAKSPPTTGPVATTATSSPKTTTTAPSQVPTNLYFVRGTELGVAQRMINGTTDPRYVTMQALLAGPDATETAAGLTTDIPAGTVVRGLEIKSGIATINLSPQFLAAGPPAALAARLGQIVYTLTAYPNIGKVVIQVSHAALPTFAGVNLSLPVGRTQVTAALPDVLLESPAVGGTVQGSTVSLSGLTSFAGTYDVQLLDATGRLLAATTNSGVVGGTFTQTLPVRTTPPTTGTVRIYARPATPGHPVQVTTFQLPVHP